MVSAQVVAKNRNVEKKEKVRTERRIPLSTEEHSKEKTTKDLFDLLAFLGFALLLGS